MFTLWLGQEITRTTTVEMKKPLEILAFMFEAFCTFDSLWSRLSVLIAQKMLPMECMKFIYGCMEKFIH